MAIALSPIVMILTRVRLDLKIHIRLVFLKAKQIEMVQVFDQDADKLIR